MKSVLFSIVTAFCCFMVLSRVNCTQLENTFKVDELSTRQLVNINGSFYYISDPILTYTVDQAINICNDLGLKLISIQTLEKQEFATDFITTNGHGNQDFWTSGMRILSDSFVWSGTGEKFSYTNWFPGQPNEASSCVLFNRDTMWWDDYCNAKHSFICEEIRKF